jgi:hypothetical protein
MHIGLVRLVNLNIVILSTTFDFKLKKTQHITNIILSYNFKKNYLDSKKLNWDTTFILSRTKIPKITSISKKYLASFAKNGTPIIFFSHYLSPSINLHSHHTTPPSNKSSQSFLANATLNHKP